MASGGSGDCGPKAASSSSIAVAPPPAIAQADGQLDHSRFIFRGILFFFQAGDFAVELQPARGELTVAVHEVVELLDFLAEFLPLGQELGDLAGAAAAIEDAVSRAFQLPQHVDQRDAIHARAEVVEKLGGLAVAERAEFLHFPQPDGEDVAEDLLVDVRQKDLEHVLALAGAVGGGEGEFFAARLRRRRRRGGPPGSARRARPTRSSRPADRRAAAADSDAAGAKSRRASSGRSRARWSCRPRSARRARSVHRKAVGASGRSMCHSRRFPGR